jgi:lactoylglutathione lyase
MAIALRRPDYIIIYVSDMQRSTVFYRDILGLPLKFSTPGWTEFATDGITIALHIADKSERAVIEGRRPAGVGQLDFIVDNLQGAYEELKAQGVQFAMPPEKQPSGRTLAVLRDPDGFGVTLQQR